MRAYVINLPRSSERRAHMVRELTKAGIDYEIVSAIDDRNLNLYDPSTIDPSYLQREDWRPGRAGNGLSHLRVYEHILADNVDRALVLEDDITLMDDLPVVADAVGEQLVGAEVALLTFDSERACELSRERLVRLPASRSLVLPIDIRQPVGAAGYVITREACERLCSRIRPIRAHSDDWSYWYEQRALDRVRCVVPHVVAKKPQFESTIDYHSPSSLKGRAIRAITRRKIPLLYQMVSYRRQHILHKWTRIEFVDKPFIAKPSRLG